MSPLHRLFLVLGLALTAPAAARAGFYTQTDLVSDAPIPGVSTTIDPNLKNPWGIANSPNGGPFWIANAASNTSTLYDGKGVVTPLIVGVPGGPTGQVFNPATPVGTPANFVISQEATPAPASFIFSTLSGQIYAWNGGRGTAAVSEASATGAAYTGLATAASVSGLSGAVLFAADVAGNKVDVYNNAFQSISGAGGLYAGKFADPGIPAGFHVFNVNNINGTLYVTYANVAGSSGGYIDTYDTSGNFLGRFAGNGPGGPLGGPWSIVLAPKTFGQFGGDLLVSNNDKGYGTIAAYDPASHAFLGLLTGPDGNPLVNDGIWALTFGNGAKNSDPNTLYFTAGANDVSGLFGSITASAVPEPGSALMVALGGGLAFVAARRRVRGC